MERVKNTSARTPRWSRDLLNLRKIQETAMRRCVCRCLPICRPIPPQGWLQETLAKMRKYAEAEKTKASLWRGFSCCAIWLL